MNRGTWAAFAAYFLWGLFPIYWKLIDTVPAFEILAHRMSWSFVVVIILLTLRQQWQWVAKVRQQPTIALTFLLSATLLAINWVTYIWGVNHGYVVDTSLGYFINPLVYVLLGVVFLKERLRRGQLLAVLVATLGVLYLLLSSDVVLWISLTLAISFGFYGLLRKTAPLGSLDGLSMETALLFLPAFGYLLFLEIQGTGHFGHADTTTNLLLGFAGIATTIPLLLFAYGAQQITLVTLGILQYLAPTMQFLIGVLIYHETFNSTRLLGFSVIWVALFIYTTENIWYTYLKTEPLKLTSQPPS